MKIHSEQNIYNLQSELSAYVATAPYPLHMPGHKRRCAPAPGLPFAWDVTELPGTDDLHGADGILAAAMARTAALWGARRSWYLVNGSTCGLLAAVRAAAPAGAEVLCARNCHKAVYHALELGGLAAHWLTPPVDAAFGVYGSVPPALVQAALDAHPRVACVILTSPNYEGVCSDIAAIAKLCHARGVPLLVDEAHGAHYLPLAVPHGWAHGALAAGADLVVQSPHKTLPSLTQTALLHLNGDLVDPAEVERQIDVFETSSPSYPLLASLDGCTGLLAAQGGALFAGWRGRLTRFSAKVAGLQRLRVLCHGGDTLADHPTFFSHDSGKILINGAAAGLTGAALASLVRTAGFEPEMSCGPNLLAMTSPCDTEDALDRFAAALCGIDAAAQGPALPPAAGILPAPGPAACTIADAVRRPRVFCPVADAAGRTAAEYIWAYPPGVPLLAPGEEITPQFLRACATLTAQGTRLRHTVAGAGQLAVLG